MPQIDRNKPLSDQDAAVDVLCAATLIAADILPQNVTMADAYEHYSSLKDRDWYYCAARDHCAVCLINE